MLELKSLKVKNFRNHREGVFPLSSKINLISGPNAIGKTSLLEAIYLCSIGESFRTSSLSDLIRHEAEACVVHLIFEKHGIGQSIQIGYQEGKKKILYNQSPVPSFSGLQGILYTVLITPEDIALVKGAPMYRRRFIDLLISQSDPLYLHHLLRFQRALKQRNTLLKTKQTHGIGPFESIFAVSAAYLTRKRRIVLRELNALIQERYQNLTCRIEPIQIQYLSKAPEEELEAYFLDEMQRLRSRELAVGSSLTGPQKDDFQIELLEKSAKYFGSEGQQRSCVIALKLAEWDYLRQAVGYEPLLMLDDFGASLDQDRSDRLANELGSFGQVIVTSPKEDVLGSGNFLRLHRTSLSNL